MGLSLGVGKFVFASTRLGLRLIGLGKKKIIRTNPNCLDRIWLRLYADRVGSG